MKIEEDFNVAAVLLITEGRLEEARAVLEAALAMQPPGWRPIQEISDEVVICCWYPDEFVSYCAAHPGKKVRWVAGSYSQAYYWLAHIAVEQEQWEQALESIMKGLELERDHPYLLCELGYIFAKLGQPAVALRIYRTAERVRPWAPDEQKARAVRGQAVSLIDLGKLDEAEIELVRSLKLDPNHPVALNELAYIAELRKAN